MSMEKNSPRPEASVAGPKPWLTRQGDDAVLAGVCCGLEVRTEISVLFWRLLFVLGGLAFGLGVVVYLALWISTRQAKSPTAALPPLFRRIDWWTALATTVVVLGGYLYTVAPDLTLEDSGELAVGSFFAGVPHPPGYPLWTIYTWLFTVLLPFSNIAWRVAVSSAVAGALSCGLVALIASRGCSMILESIEEFRALERKWENALCMSAGYVAGMLIGFNGFMWSQAVIVEVYPFSLLSFMVMMATLLRWIHAPNQYRYLYWALFMFGVSFTNHMTLIVAAMGIEVAVAVANPKLGRDLFAGNFVLFLGGLLLKQLGWMQSFDNNGPLFTIYVLVGLGSLATYVYLAVTTGAVLGRSTVFVCLMLGLFWILGASFYLFMPLSSSTNPPMNWGYARTFEGFLHALTRGQYERTNPTSDLERFMSQMGMLLNGAIEEFNVVYLVIAVLPFVYFLRLQRRERAWLLGLVSMYACLAVLLIMLLNPSPDRQSREMNRVFFIASHVMIALCVAYGLAIVGALLATQYAFYRRTALGAAAVAAALAFYAVTVVYQTNKGSILAGAGLFGLAPSWDPLVRATAVFTLVLAVAGVALFVIARERAPLAALIGLFVAMPLESVLSHWSENEQRGHLFGYWFGHDMFEPPFGLYPRMAQNAVLFGGTDPGRFCPTYMIFCESFIPGSCKPRDPEFDRRDVYIITQNALADQTYLNYIRAHYNRSTQVDTPFLQGAVGWLQEKVMDKFQMELKRVGRPHVTNGLAATVGSLNLLARPLDQMMTDFGARVEARRRKELVYPPKEIYTPNAEDHARCMQEYFSDANRRRLSGQLRTGEDVHLDDNNQLQVSGQVAVMAINALLTKVIFDHNPTNEFYVEESFPLDWMFPYLEPYGIIMKINRKPLSEITEEQTQRDREFWAKFSERLIGNWITPETSVDEVCRFIERVYERRDYTGFKGDRKFIRDDQAQKSFSKLRSSIGGLYAWRLGNARVPAEQQRMLREAEFALKQAFAFCPYSPEAVYRYSSLLFSAGRFKDAELVVETCLRFDQDNGSIKGWLQQLRQFRQTPGAAAAAMSASSSGGSPSQQRLAQLEESFRAAPTNAAAAFDLASLYLHLGRTNDALGTFDVLMKQPINDPNTLLSLATAFAQLGDGSRLERTLLHLVEVTPDSPEAWFDLASTRAAIGKPKEAVESLARAIEVSDRRRAKDPAAKDLRVEAATNRNFLALQNRPDFQAAVRR